MFNRSLIALFLVFAPLSVISFGGGQAIVADIQRQSVSVYGWLNDQQFTDLFAVSRAAPGPSTLISALIGWRVAGFWGAVVAAIAMYLPSSMIMYAAASWWERQEGSAWRAAIERGLAPVAVGLIFAGAFSVLQSAHILGAGRIDPLGLAVALGGAMLLRFTSIGPYILMAATAVLYGLWQFA